MLSEYSKRRAHLTVSWAALLLLFMFFGACSPGAETIIIEEKTPDYSVSAIELNPDLSATRDYWPTEEWRIKTPQETGMDAELLEKTMEYVENDDVYSLIIVKNGYVVLEYYDSGFGKSSLFDIYSCTKSVTSSLIGMLMDKGEITSVEQPLSDFFPEIKEMGDAQKEQILLKHVLTMTIGIEWPFSGGREVYMDNIRGSRDWNLYVLEKTVVAPPGSVFTYNSGGSHLLSSIVTRITGRSAEEYARENLFDKIGVRQVAWSKDRQGNSIGGWGLAMRPLDMARFGFLYLNNGTWNSEQLISKEWIKASTADHTGGFWFPVSKGYYGYQWWISSADSERTKYFSASGSYGQHIYIAPAFDLVVVFTCNLYGNGIMNPIFYMHNYIIPACKQEQRRKDIIVKNIEPFYYCAVEMKGSREKVWDTFGTLYTEVWEQRTFPEITPFIIYHNDPFSTPESELEWEVGRALNKKTAVETPLTVKKWNHVLHISTTVPGSLDDEEQEKTVAGLRDWIAHHNYKQSGPLMKRLFQKPIIDGKSGLVERIEFLIPVEEKR
jgi:CubicO group peptidase (beta-lactamase class C family)